MAKYSRHGFEGSRTYTSWSLMKQRCGNPNNDRYAAYGGKGITRILSTPGRGRKS
jgi:hypothetical protein